MSTDVAQYVAETCRWNWTLVASHFYVLLHCNYFVVSVIGTRSLIYRLLSNMRVHYPANESLPSILYLLRVTVKFLRTKVPCTLRWPYAKGTWFCWDYFIWCVSCVVVIWTCFVMCGCFGNMYTCIYCVLYCFVYVYLFLFVLSVLV